jgi:uncharacterized protein YodC (DUF2158 family)
MPDSFNIGDLVRVKTHSDPIMKVVEVELPDRRSGKDGVVHCEWEDYGTTPPTRRSFRFAVADLVPVAPPKP